jgi:hypothetical protein
MRGKKGEGKKKKAKLHFKEQFNVDMRPFCSSISHATRLKIKLSLYLTN